MGGKLPDDVYTRCSRPLERLVSLLYRALRQGTVLKWLRGREPFHFPEDAPRVAEFGTKYGRWAIDPSHLDAQTRIVCFGLGDDVSFELALIEQFGCHIHGYDPTPQALEYLRSWAQSPRLSIHAVALAVYDGTLAFRHPPAGGSDRVNASAVADYGGHDIEAIDVPCLTLASVKKSLGWDRIDVLKIDIEGSEYGVIDQAAREGWLDEVQQLLVEFHHFLPGLSVSQTAMAVTTLKESGFRIGWIGRTNHEYLFVR